MSEQEINPEPRFAAFSVTGLGARVAVYVDDLAIVPALLAALPPLCRAEDFRAGDASLTVLSRHIPDRPLNRAIEERDHHIGGLGASRNELVGEFEAHLRFGLAQFARDVVAIHAGAVAWRGCAIIIPGTSYSGKSTLTAALIKAGADYITDEHVLLDPSGLLLPWPKPLSIRGADHRQRDVPASAYGAQTARQPVPVGLILSTAYVADATWDPQSMSGSEAALALVENAIAVRLEPQRVLTACAAAARHAIGIRSRRPAAETIVSQVLGLLDNHAGGLAS